jgi:hypothetical protein
MKLAVFRHPPRPQLKLPPLYELRIRRRQERRLRSGGERADHRLRLLFDDLQEDARRAVGCTPADLPFLHGGLREAEAVGEFGANHASRLPIACTSTLSGTCTAKPSSVSPRAKARALRTLPRIRLPAFDMSDREAAFDRLVKVAHQLVHGLAFGGAAGQGRNLGPEPAFLRLVNDGLDLHVVLRCPD